MNIITMHVKSGITKRREMATAEYDGKQQLINVILDAVIVGDKKIRRNKLSEFRLGFTDSEWKNIVALAKTIFLGNDDEAFAKVFMFTLICKTLDDYLRTYYVDFGYFPKQGVMAYSETNEHIPVLHFSRKPPSLITISK
jgi:hypothetical protein